MRRVKFFWQVFFGLVIFLAAIFAGNIVPDAQEKNASALESSAICYTADPAYPNGYEYVPGAVDVWVVYSDENGNDNGPIPGVQIHAQALHNGACEADPSCPQRARTEVDGPGCGFSADGTTDNRGFTHLEPLNCGHDNFALTIPSGLPPNVGYVSATVDGGGLNQRDISNLELNNGATNVVKLFYQPIGGYTTPPTYTTPYVTPYTSPPTYPTPYTSPHTTPYTTPYVTPIGGYTTPYTTPYTSPYTSPYTYPSPAQPYTYPTPAYVYPTPVYTYPTPIVSSVITIPAVPNIVLSPTQNQSQQQTVNITQPAPPPVVIQQHRVLGAAAPKVLPKTGVDSLLGVPILIGLAAIGGILKRRFKVA